MSRGNVELIHAGEVAPEPLAGAGWPIGASARVLSHDDGTGALTALVTLPQGYRRPAGAIAVESEHYVLSGALRIGADVREAGWYEYAPGGSRQAEWAVAEHCQLLLMARGGPPDFVTAARRPCERSAAAIAVDSGGMRWTAERVPNEAPGAAFKRLRYDPSTGGYLILAAFVPRWHSGAARVFHDGPEEGYVIAGEMTNGLGGTMRAGSYFWHAPYEGHGPHDSHPGALVITHVDAFVVNHVSASATSTAAENRRQALGDTPAADHPARFVPPREV